ncbi:MAG: DinB family protein [Steroidobacteraceae bacterium]
MKLAPAERETLLADLDAMPGYLERELGALTGVQLRQQGPDGGFSPLQQIWHLADLEREGFGWRIERLLDQDQPLLPDFDGAALALARNYSERSVTEGLAAFREARRHNLTRLRSLSGDAWLRGGRQQGVGEILLCDIPGFMSQHDAAHRAELAAWKQTQISG